jgi:hypothetical protein
MISVFEQNGSRIKRFSKPEGSDFSEAVLKVFKQQRSDIVSMNGPLLVISFWSSQFLILSFHSEPEWKFTIIEE